MIYFDDSIPAFAKLIVDEAGAPTLERGVFFRDASGRLTFIVPDSEMSAEQRRVLSEKASAVVAPYVDVEGYCVSSPSEGFFPEEIVFEGWVQSVDVDGKCRDVRLIDQRVAGGDWLSKPAPLSPAKRFVFASLKGGVGRSTALCVAAAAMAERGVRVLAIDMDVEAPGLGSMLLAADAVPEYGLLDYLVETNVGAPTDEFILSTVAPSWLSRGHGVINVLPALGKSSFANKRNVISKMARAYLDVGSGASGSLTGRMQALLSFFDQRAEYDVVLIDARAGLHETTGSAILGLGGQVVLFGIDQPQTFAAYELLMANLRLVEPAGWENRLLPVQAKAKPDLDDVKDFSDRFGQLLAGTKEAVAPPAAESYLASLDGVFDIEWNDEEIAPELASELLEATLSESESSFEVTYILESELFRDFDPLGRPDNLMEAAYQSVYGAFLNALFQRLAVEYGDPLNG